MNFPDSFLKKQLKTGTDEFSFFSPEICDRFTAKDKTILTSPKALLKFFTCIFISVPGNAILFYRVPREWSAIVWYPEG